MRVKRRSSGRIRRYCYRIVPYVSIRTIPDAADEFVAAQLSAGSALGY